MTPNSKNKSLGREELKNYFRNGQIPTENHFELLINSMINKQDDGFDKDADNGFMVAATGNSKKFLTLYKDVNDLEPFFSFEKDEQGKSAMKLNTAAGDDSDDKSFFFGKEGNMGIGKRCDKDMKMQVDGFVGMSGRTGTFKSGEEDADGKWKTILEGLDYCNAFEIVARTGKRGTGKFAFLHAIAVATFGHSRSRIRKTSAHYGFFWNKINLRWRGTTHNYKLQIKTNSNYGHNTKIFYKITQLWDDELFMPAEYYK